MFLLFNCIKEKKKFLFKKIIYSFFTYFNFSFEFAKINKILFLGVKFTDDNRERFSPSQNR